MINCSLYTHDEPSRTHKCVWWESGPQDHDTCGLHCVAVWCGVLPCVVLQRIAACCSMYHHNVWIWTSGLRHWRSAWEASSYEHGDWYECVAACCSVLQSLAASCSVLQCLRTRALVQCVAACCSVCICMWCFFLRTRGLVWVCCSMLQCVAASCSVMQCICMRCLCSRTRGLVWMSCSELQRVAVYVREIPLLTNTGTGMSVLQHVAVCCRVLPRVAACCSVCAW